MHARVQKNKNSGGRGASDIYVFQGGGVVSGQFLTILLCKFEKFTHTPSNPPLDPRMLR